jgi:hypothetical protein
MGTEDIQVRAEQNELSQGPMQQKALPHPKLHESSTDKAAVEEEALGVLTGHGQGE